MFSKNWRMSAIVVLIVVISAYIVHHITAENGASDLNRTLTLEEREKKAEERLQRAVERLQRAEKMKQDAEKMKQDAEKMEQEVVERELRAKEMEKWAEEIVASYIDSTLIPKKDLRVLAAKHFNVTVSEQSEHSCYVETYSTFQEPELWHNYPTGLFTHQYLNIK
ncbi:uncharacterized protein LOC135834491 isoform X2 [Planococcus citri]|uniref:uncharacterized protein LOC135834491 isoform X2 n=1 Tax=Planococcus citri TaxID=170843 RepID=UPI0031FA3CA2